MAINGFKLYLSSTIGKKQIVGITGLGVSFFTLIHMSGNLLLFAGAEIYNKYSHNLVSNPMIYIAEAGLLLAFLTHVFFTVQLTMANRAAKGMSPSQGTNKAKGVSFAAKTAILSGLLLLAFLILHLITFKFGDYYEATYGGVVIRDIYRVALEKFQSPYYVGWYILCLLLLGLHLSHGISASFQSLGISNVRNGTLKKIGWAFAILITAGFITQPLYFYFGGGR